MYNIERVHAYNQPAQGRRFRHARSAPGFLNLLKLGVGAKVEIAVENDRLIIVPKVRRRYSLDELLAQCDETATLSAEDRDWIDAKPVGNELL